MRRALSRSRQTAPHRSSQRQSTEGEFRHDQDRKGDYAHQRLRPDPSRGTISRTRMVPRTKPIRKTVKAYSAPALLALLIQIDVTADLGWVSPAQNKYRLVRYALQSTCASGSNKNRPNTLSVERLLKSSGRTSNERNTSNAPRIPKRRSVGDVTLVSAMLANGEI